MVHPYNYVYIMSCDNPHTLNHHKVAFLPFLYTMSRNTSSAARAALLGGSSSTPTRQGAEDAYIYEQQNDLRMTELDSKVAALKNVTIDIHREVSSQHQLLDKSQSIFSDFGQSFTNTFGRFNRMVSTRHRRSMVYYIAGIITVFWVFWWLLKFSTGRGEREPEV